MPEPFKKLRQFFNSEAERDKAFSRKLEKDSEIAAGHRVIRKIWHREGEETLYGYEVKRV